MKQHYAGDGVTCFPYVPKSFNMYHSSYFFVIADFNLLMIDVKPVCMTFPLVLPLIFVTFTLFNF